MKDLLQKSILSDKFYLWLMNKITDQSEYSGKTGNDYDILIMYEKLNGIDALIIFKLFTRKITIEYITEYRTVHRHDV